MFLFLLRYGFVEFDDPRDADDAVYDLNGKDLCGERVIVEHTKGPRRDGSYGGRSKCPVKFCFVTYKECHSGGLSLTSQNKLLQFLLHTFYTCPWWLMCIQFTSK